MQTFLFIYLNQFVHFCHFGHGGFGYIEFLTPIIALIGVIIALFQLAKNNKNRMADFTHRLDNDFFTKETENFIILIDLELIEFIEINKDDCFFKIKQQEVLNLSGRYSVVKEFSRIRNYEISTQEMDDYYLGLFEKIGLYGKTKVINIEFIYECFDYYIQLAYENNEIKKYIKWIREHAPEDEDIYDKFYYIALECQKYGRIKKNR